MKLNLGRKSKVTYQYTAYPYFIQDGGAGGLNGFNSMLLTTNITTFFAANKSESLIGIKAYPFDISQLVPTTTNNGVIYIGGGTINNFPALQPTSSADATDTFIYLANVDIPKLYGSFNYMSSKTHQALYVYLPFYGNLYLDNDVFYQATTYRLSICYHIDILSGDMTYYIGIGNITGSRGNYSLNNFEVYKTVTCKVGIDIPYTNSNSNDVARNKVFSSLSAISAIGTGIATGGATLPQSIISGATNFINNGIEHVETSGSVGDTSIFLHSTTPYVIRQYKQILDPSKDNVNKGTFMGYKTDKIATVSELDGYYFEINNVHLENFNKTLSSEIDEIESLLKQGVIG